MGWNPRDICCRTRDFRSRDGACRGLARRRQAPPLAPTPGADRGPGLPALASSRTSSHATFSVRAPFSLQTPVERSERMAECWAVRARAHPLSLGVWHFTLRFVLPRSWVGYPSPRPKGCGMQSLFGPKVYPKSIGAKMGFAAPSINKAHRQSNNAPPSVISDDAEGLAQGSVLASALRLDHPFTLGIGGIGCDTASGGASARGDC